MGGREGGRYLREVWMAPDAVWVEEDGMASLGVPTSHGREGELGRGEGGRGRG